MFIGILWDEVPLLDQRLGYFWEQVKSKKAANNIFFKEGEIGRNLPFEDIYCCISKYIAIFRLGR